MSYGFVIGAPEPDKNMPCLLGRPRGCEKPMAKPKLKVEDKVRFLVLARADYKCERCGGGPTGYGFSVHHRAPRMMGGSRDTNLHLPANLIVLCGSGVDGCHGWVESNRDKARADGYLLFRIDKANEVPFIDKFTNAWLIDNNGDKKQFDTNRTLP